MFKVGDRVKIVGTTYDGLVGRIESKALAFDWYLVLDDGNIFLVDEGELELIRFKVGDRVKLLRGESIDNNATGCTGVIDKDEGADFYNWFEARDVCRVLSGESKDKIVQLTGKAANGMGWFINSLDRSKVTCECGCGKRVKGARISSSQLELVARPKFKIGDYVTSSVRHVNSVFKLGRVGTYTDGSTIWYYGVPTTGGEETGLWEKYLTLTTCCEFKVGDLVRRKAGNIGKIEQVDTIFNCVKVSTSSLSDHTWLPSKDVEKV